MSGFGKTPTTTTQGALASNQVFISSVAVPGHSNSDLTALRGANAATDSNGNELADVSAEVVDRWARQLGQVDLARVLGSALSNTNPVPIEPNIQNWLRAGQAFVVNDSLVSGASATCGLSIWNATSGKNALIYSIRYLDQQGGQSQVGQLYKVTSNPALANSATPVNKNFGSGTTSLMTCTSASSGVNLSSGTLLESFPTNSPAIVELIQPGSGYFLPGNANTGLGIQVAMSGTGGFVQLSVHFVEF